MKTIFLILLLGMIAKADQLSIEAIGGSVTYHVIDDGASSKYVTKLNGDGRLIYNQLYGARILSEDPIFYKSLSIFGGKNSIGSDMTGALFSYGITRYNFYLGWTIGGYEQDDDSFRNQGINPYRLTEIGNQGLVPIVGIELNYKVKLGTATYLKVNNIISPVITNTSASLGYEFN